MNNLDLFGYNERYDIFGYNISKNKSVKPSDIDNYFKIQTKKNLKKTKSKKIK